MYGQPWQLEAHGEIYLHVIEAHVGKEGMVSSPLISKPYGGKWLDSIPGLFTRGERATCT
jgi:hypothetical protein